MADSRPDNLMIALGLAIKGKNPTMPPRNSSELASDSVLSKMLAASACMVCRGGGVVRGGWKAWQSARLHTARTSRLPEGGIVSLRRRELAALLDFKCRSVFAPCLALPST